MISQQQYQQAVEKTVEMLKSAGIAFTPEEKGRIEVADFGLGELEKTGLEIITYINTERVCAKEIMMFPHQTCPEHLHPPVAGQLGKEETFRCRWGTVYLYVPGVETALTRRPAARGLGSLLQGETRSGFAPRGSVHADAGHVALVPSRAGGSDCLRVLHAQH